MPGPTRYVIEVRLAGGGDDGNAQGSQVQSATGGSGANAAGKGNKKTATAVGVAAAYGITKRLVDKGVAHYVNTIELRTGQQLYQERMQFFTNAAQRIWSIGEAAAIGAMAGGPVGAVVGAATSALSQISQIFNAALDYSFEQDRLNMARQVEQIGLTQAAIRAGAAGSRGGKTY